MIDDDAFIRGFTVLMERFRTDYSEPTIRLYADTLDAELDTDDFRRAVNIIFRHDTFFPSPQRFIDVVHGTLTDHAERSWRAVVAALQDRQGGPLDLTDTEAAALVAAGGTYGIATAQSDFALDAFRRRYVDAYVTERQRTSGEQTPALDAPSRKKLP